ncbi:TlpA family protein disulfide reductase [Candidatus Thorarchaeota archaeon]|nr:MAG: TlpA family protein disulfide reductase [Candidatus Thorarchaeota archaeon]
MNAEKIMIGSVIAAIVIVGLLIGFSLASFSPSDQNTGGNSGGSPDIQTDVDLIDQELEVPNWGLIMSDGEVLELESLEGKFLLVDLMAFGCSACELQNDEFETLMEDMGDNIHVVSLNVDTSATADQMADYKEDRSLAWYHGLDTNGVFSSYFSIRFTPTIVIIDDTGYFRMYHEGVWESETIQEQISLMDN